MMEEQVGGLRGAAQAAGDSVSDTVNTNTVDQAAGRRVHRVVRTDQGLIIAAPGQIVTEQVINRARTYHKEQELMDATGLSTGDAAHGAVSGAATSISGAASSAGESVREGAQSAKVGAANLWERVKTRVGETQQTMAEEAEERRIKNAVGRPVTRVILDPQDNVILNVGEIITHQAVERSRAVGVLDMLLSSVYDKDPEISPDELRAPEPGQAALEQQNKEAGA